MKNHPLFPPLDDDEDEDGPEVEQIHVTRSENGGQPFCPYLFGADELTDLQQIYDNFGGGKYELRARANGKISAKRRYEIAGRSRPLVINTSGVETEAPHPVAPVVSHQGDSGMATMMLQFMQMNAEANRSMMQMMMQASTNTMTAMTTMTTAMLSRDGDGNKTLITALQANNERALQGQAQVFSTMLEALGKGSGGGKDAVTSFKEGLELGASLSDDDDKDSTNDTISNVVDGLRMVSSLTADAPPVAEVA